MCAIKGPPGNPPHQSDKISRIARTYALTVPYNQCLGSRADPLSFASLRLVDLRNGQSQYLSTVKQLVDALPRTISPSSHYALRGHIARPGQQRLRHSMRAAIWWLLPSDGIFRRTSDSLQYFLTRQGRRVVLRGGDVTLPPWERYMNWVHDPAPPPTRYHGDLTSPAPSENQENTPPQDASRKLPLVETQQPAWLAQRPSLGHQPIGIRLSRKPTQRPSRGQRLIGIRRLLEIGLEPVGQTGVLQWSIFGPSCTHSIHSIPDSGPIRIRDANLTRTTLNSGVYINMPSQASSRIQPTDFVESPSPDLASPHLPFSDLIDTPSLNRPLGS